MIVVVCVWLSGLRIEMICVEIENDGYGGNKLILYCIFRNLDFFEFWNI